jgi:hypothetical protein
LRASPPDRLHDTHDIALAYGLFPYVWTPDITPAMWAARLNSIRRALSGLKRAGLVTSRRYRRGSPHRGWRLVAAPAPVKN